MSITEQVVSAIQQFNLVQLKSMRESARKTITKQRILIQSPSYGQTALLRKQLARKVRLAETVDSGYATRSLLLSLYFRSSKCREASAVSEILVSKTIDN